MKKLEELGITRAPWRLFLGKPFCDKLTRLIQAAPGVPCFTIGEVYEVPDAQMACASPKLYEALYDMVVMYRDGGSYEYEQKVISKAKAAIAEAAGEDVSDGE